MFKETLLDSREVCKPSRLQSGGLALQSEDVNYLKVESGKGLDVYAHSWVKKRKGVQRTTREKS